MNRYEEGLRLIKERCAGKDNVISLATISMLPAPDGKAMPAVRNVDAYYEDGSFYIVTYAKSGKMLQIEQNRNVAFCVNLEWFSGSGTAENIGWVLDPKNAEIRKKLREVFAEWYDEANNEENEDCCILAIRITSGIVIKDHGALRYDLDFINKKETGDI